MQSDWSARRQAKEQPSALRLVSRKARRCPVMPCLVAFACAGWDTHLVAAAPYELRFSPETMAVSAVVKGKVVPLIEGVGYAAQFSESEEAFHTEGIEAVDGIDGSWTVRYRLGGPAAAAASVTCRAQTVSKQCLRLTWEIEYTGEQRPFFGWTDGLRLEIPARPVSARSRPLIKWVRPSGRHEWEVPGDAPYPVVDRQLREINLGAARLIILTSWYDPDWFYNRNLGVVSFLKLGLPSKTPQKTVAGLEILAAPDGVADEDLLALATEEPLSVAVSTGPGLPVRSPGQAIGLTARFANVTASRQKGRLRWGVYDYYGCRVAGGDTAVSLAPGQSSSIDLSKGVTARRGMYFLAGELSMAGGKRRLLRATLACLPQRPVAINESSPFGMAALPSSPDPYPDQPALEAGLAMMARIGVHWVRAASFRVAEDIKPEEVQKARAFLARLNKYGLQLHGQTYHPVPKDEAEVQALRRRLAAALAHFRFLSRYVELGNEYNFDTKAADYVRLMLRPQYEVMREVFPEGKVMNAGLGGVAADWWQEFVDAGGLEYVDALSVHPGHFPRAPEFWEGWDGWVFRPQMLRVFETLAARGLADKKEVWVTEAYAPSSPVLSGLDMRTAADYLVREYCLLLALGTRVIEWYQFRDGTWYSAAPKPDDIEFNFGVVYADLSPKPQYVAYGVMTEQLEGAECLGRLDLGAEDLYGIRFRARDGAPIDVLWSYRERHECDLSWWPPEEFAGKHRLPAEPWVERWKAPVEVTLPAAGAVIVTDLMGNSRRLQATSGRVRLSLTGSPIYVRGLGDLSVSHKVW